MVTIMARENDSKPDAFGSSEPVEAVVETVEPAPAPAKSPGEAQFKVSVIQKVTATAKNTEGEDYEHVVVEIDTPAAFDLPIPVPDSVDTDEHGRLVLDTTPVTVPASVAAVLEGLPHVKVEPA